MKKIILIVSGILVVVIVAAVAVLYIKPKNRNLRGAFEPSGDGKTYLAIVNDNGGGCESILIDGEEWKLQIGETQLISAGAHRIQCGKGDSGIEFIIPEATVFRFDYWGP